MRSPEREKDLLTRSVRTGDPVQINLHVSSRAALVDGLGEADCPVPNELSFYDNLGSIALKEHRDSQHSNAGCSFLAK